ncbi:MAG: hypothetical protein KAY32_07230 [Candidatus Eisenbacteria sp.]|nr:hypothetical protein [Candidatus Eisenbacteria bacterium]
MPPRRHQRHQWLIPPWVGARAMLSALAALALLLTAGGCDEDERLCRPGVAGGRIEGRVRTGVLPVDAEIQIYGIPEGDRRRTDFQTTVDSTGHYGLDVPADRYVLRVYERSTYGRFYYRAAGLSYNDDLRDTLIVDYDRSPVIADFDLGSLEIHVDLSAALDEQWSQVLLYCRDGEPPAEILERVDSERTKVANGALDFLYGGVPPGEYKVEIVISPRDNPIQERFWLPGVVDPTASPWITVAANETVAASGTVVSEPARVEGEVVGAWREFNLGRSPNLFLYDLDSLQVVGPIPVAADGSFAAEIYLPRPVKILISQFNIDQWIGGMGFDEAEIFPLEAGQTITGVHFSQCGLYLTGAEPDMHLTALVLELYTSPGQMRVAQWHTSSIHYAAVGIPNLRPGTYRLRIEPRRSGLSPWQPQWFNRTSTFEEAETITIAAEGEIVPLAISLERGGAIRGTVIEPEEAHRPGYVLLVTPADTSACWGYVYTMRPTSNYEALGLPDGDWKVGATTRLLYDDCPLDPPDDTIWYPGTADWEAATVIEIRDHGEVSGIDIPAPEE